MTYDYDHLIIGGGSAGLSLASAAAQLGVKVCLVDKNMLGGDCLHYGCVPSKTLIKSAKVAHYQNTAAQFGLPQTPQPIKWDQVVNRIRTVQNHIQQHDHPDRFRQMGCAVIFGEAKFLEAHRVDVKLSNTWKKFQSSELQTQNRIQLTAKKITIATGSRPRIPSIPGLKEAGFITNEHLFTLRNRPRKMAIIGGGVIAAEIAQALNRLGTEVTILEHAPRFLGRLDTEVQHVINEQLKNEGINILTNSQVEKVEGHQTEKKLHLTVEGQAQSLLVDTILVAAGRQANTDLNLEAAGVEYTDRGVTIAPTLRTSQSHITAIGDVNGHSMFTHTANYEAGIVLVNEVLRSPFKQKVDYQKIGWTIFTDPEIASIGHSEASAQKAKINYKVAKFDLAKNDRAQAENQTSGFVKVLVAKKRVIGAQIVAPRAGEMIREWQLAIEHKIPFNKIARSTYIYPTFGEANKWAASTFYAPQLFSKTVKTWLRIIHRYRGRHH